MNTSRLKSIRWSIFGITLLGVCLSLLLSACGPNPKPPSGENATGDSDPNGPHIQAVDFLDTPRPLAQGDAPATLGAAKNETTGFGLRLANMPIPAGKGVLSLRIQPLRVVALASDQANPPTNSPTIAPSNFSAYQVVPMPIDSNRAAYVRHTGQSAAVHRLPRALLPTAIDDGLLNLSNVRQRTKSLPMASENPSEDASILLWIDLHIPVEAPGGEYETRCEVLQTGNDHPIATMSFRISVYDFVLPDERHLMMVGQLPWEALTRLYADRFEAVTSRLMNRKDDRYAPAISTLDAIQKLARAHRVEVVIPRLQPTVKWPAGKPPAVDWRDYDSVVTPWLKGDAFPDKIPLGYWPLPAVDYLDRFDRKSQLDYWSDAATHFDQNEWLTHSTAFIDKPTPGRAGAAEAISISAEAAQILAVHPRIRVTVPLEDDQLQFASQATPNLLDPQSTARLMTASPNLVYAPPVQGLPAGANPPARWLRTDLPGLVPYASAGGDERDVRLWAWLAFMRNASYILWNEVLPTANDPTRPADPNELVWFYPGSWFGLEEPVPTIQLKWLRRAQQDYEYLWLVKQRGEVINALLMSRLMSKPVQIQAHQSADPTYALMCGTTDPKSWAEAQRIIARTVLLREPGQAVDPVKRNELNLQMLRWIEPQDRALLMGRTTNWLIDPLKNSPGENWINLRLGIDIYNASDNTPDQNTLQWTAMPPGWQVRPQPIPIASLETYHVSRFNLEGRFNLDRITPGARQPTEITFTNGFTNRSSKLKLVMPVALSERREGRLAMDGSLGEWTIDDAIHDGPLVQMFDRPTLQSQEIRMATVPASIFSGWAEENFYLAFKLTGIAPADTRSTRNFATYQSRRAWGEDLCEILIQPVYDNNSLGPVMHIVCKPNGGSWVERKLDPRLNADPWQPLEGAAVRYAATVDGSDWRGEVAIPWKAINDPSQHRPTLLRFNFVQHRTTTGESASWAGPIDFGRDDAFTGLLYLREHNTPGMGQAAER